LSSDAEADAEYRTRPDMPRSRIVVPDSNRHVAALAKEDALRSALARKAGGRYEAD